MAFTPDFVTGFEHQTLSSVALSNATAIFAAVTGTPTIDTTVARTPGVACMKCDSSATAHNVNGAPQVSNTTIIGRFYMRIDSAIALTGTNAAAIILQSANANGNLRIDLLNDATMRGNLGANAVTGTPSPALSFDRWYCIDYKFDSSGANATVDFMIDGVPQPQTTRAQTSAAMTTHALGNAQNAASTTSRLYFDDWVRSVTSTDTYPVGPGFVYGHVPVADGTHSTGASLATDAGGTLAADSTTWARIDEWPANTTDWISQTATTGTVYAEHKLTAMPANNAGYTAIHGVRVIAALQSPASTLGDNQQLRLYDGTTESASLWSTSIGSTTLTYKAVQSNTRPSGGVWLPTDFQLQTVRTRWGYSSDASPIPEISALMVEVSYSTVPQARLIVVPGQAVKRSRLY